MPATAWVPLEAGNPNISVEYLPFEAGLKGEGSARKFFAGVTLPSILQGRPVRVDSFELCYDAGVSAVLSEVSLEQTFATPSEAGVHTLFGDTTDRTDSTCRTYSGNAPVTVGPTEGIVVGVTVDYPGSANVLGVLRLTLNLST